MTSPPPLADMRLASNAASPVLDQMSSTSLESVRHASVISTPGDDLANEDFIPRMQQIVAVLPSLTHLTLTIPTMARLHPSSSLPKVVTVFESLRALRPSLRFSFAICSDFRQVFSSGPLFRQLALDAPNLHSVALTGSNLLLEDLTPVVAKCGIAELSFDHSQITGVTTGDDADFSSIRKLSLDMDVGANADEKVIAGHETLVKACQGTLQDLALGSCRPDFLDRVGSLPCMKCLSIREDFLQSLAEQSMPSLEELHLQTLIQQTNADHLASVLKASWCNIRRIHVATLPVGSKCEGLLALRKTFPQLSFRIGEYVTEPPSLDFDALEIAESLSTYGAPSAALWPIPQHSVHCPHLRALNLKVADGSNYADLLAKLEMDNLDGAPKVTIAKMKQAKVKKNRI